MIQLILYIAVKLIIGIGVGVVGLKILKRLENKRNVTSCEGTKTITFKVDGSDKK